MKFTLVAVRSLLQPNTLEPIYKRRSTLAFTVDGTVIVAIVHARQESCRCMATLLCAQPDAQHLCSKAAAHLFLILKTHCLEIPSDSISHLASRISDLETRNSSMTACVLLL